MRWLEALDAARSALTHSQFAYFTQHLPPAAHWRILPDALRDALYLDIETTGLSRDLHSLTVIGALYRGRFYQWTWPEGIETLCALLSEAPLIVTFNGGRFDLPFLRHHFPSLPLPGAHVDLRAVAAQAGFGGGLKSVEEALGLARPDEVQGIGGEEAVALWCRSLYGDRAAYRKLLAYNREDVVMLRAVGERLVHRLQAALSPEFGDARSPSKSIVAGKRAAPFEQVRAAWCARHMTIESLEPALVKKFGRLPVVVGVDLRGKAHNPTGLASCVGSAVDHAILFEDDEIFDWTCSHSPDLVSIDAPLSLPRGRTSPFDDDPQRPSCGIVRDAERILWSRRIRVYPALIKHMQQLTARGIALTERFRSAGIEVIESYPGAAQDVLGIPRKGVRLDLLHRGIRDFGFDVKGMFSHDELDAVTSALVGYCYIAGCYEGLGADDENYLIVPRTDTLRWPDVATPGVACA